MKRLCVISLVVFMFTAYSCKSLKHVQFDSNFHAALTIPAQQTANTTSTLYATSITTNIASLVQSNNTRTDLINSVRLTGLTAMLTSPSSETFAFMDDIRVLISTDSQ